MVKRRPSSTNTGRRSSGSSSVSPGRSRAGASLLTATRPDKLGRFSVRRCNDGNCINLEAPNPGDPRVEMARRRTTFASFRMGLALDRTTLAWIRTTLGIAGFCFGMVGFFRSLEEKNPSAQTVWLHAGAVRMGVVLIILGIVATVL